MRRDPVVFGVEDETRPRCVWGGLVAGADARSALVEALGVWIESNEMSVDTAFRELGDNGVEGNHRR